MASITGARNYVDVPTPAPKVGGVLDVVRVVNSSDRHDLLGAEYQTDACFTLDEWLSNCGNYPDVDCEAGTVAITTSKVFHGLSVVEGDPFSLYTGVECPFPGAGIDVYRPRAEAAFALKESRGVEERLTALFAAWPGSYTVAVSAPADAVAAMEKFLEENYAGQGYIYMTRSMATLAGAAQAIGRNTSGDLVTVVGTPVVLGVGDPSTIFASGQITLLRGPVIINTAAGMNVGDTCYAPRTLAERTYVPLIECGVAKATTAAPAP